MQSNVRMQRAAASDLMNTNKMQQHLRGPQPQSWRTAHDDAKAELFVVVHNTCL
jgi:hypothetical protein